MSDMGLLTEDNIKLFSLFIIPGFLSLKIWGLLHPSQKLVLSESIMEALVFSCFNYITTYWLYSILDKADCIWIYFLIVLFITPIVWPVLLKFVLTSRSIKNKIISITPKSWDYFFNKRECCFMLVHINNGDVIGGLYGDDSFASSYPEKNDVYLQEIWETDEDGKFKEKIPNTRGLLINPDIIDYIELFTINEEEIKNA